MRSLTIPVLIVGAGPVGLATALDLGWRKLECLIIDREADQEKAINVHPRAAAVTPRSMEFCRRWGVAEAVHESGFPKDLTPNIVYCTDLQGPTVTVQRFASMNERKPLKESPEHRQRCPQIWFDPILERGLARYPSVMLRRPWQLDRFEDRGDSVRAYITDRATGESIEVSCQYLVACDGPVSGVRKQLGIGLTGKGVLSYSINAVVDIPNFFSHHDKGPAERYMFLDPRGVWANLTVIDGRDRWRFGYAGSEAAIDRAAVDIPGLLRKMLGPDVPFNVVAIAPWRRREAVAERFRAGRVLLAGDAAHTIPPNLGMGMNTGLGDAVDLGWKLEAVLRGWGGESLLDSYEVERRPVAVNISEISTRTYQSWMSSTDDYHDIAAPGEKGETARARVREYLAKVLPDGWDTLGLQLGYRYENSPLCIDDGSPPPPPPARLGEYIPTTRPGARAPHAWLTDGRSILDLYGRGFVLLCLSASGIASPAPAAALQRWRRAALACALPLSIVELAQDDIAQLYALPFVLVRPDGHVAWRGSHLPDSPEEILDRVRGAVRTPLEETAA